MNRIRDWYDRDRGPSRNFNDDDRPIDRSYDRPFDHERDDVRGRDFGWRGTELDRGFGGPTPRYDNRYGSRYDHPQLNRDRSSYRGEPYRPVTQPYRPRGAQPYRSDFDNRPRFNERDRDDHRGTDRYRDDDRYRYATGDPYLDRGYESSRDSGRDEERDRERGRDYWDDYPWSSRRW